MFNELCELFFPEECLLCQNFSNILCQNCLKTLEAIANYNVKKINNVSYRKLISIWSYQLVSELLKAAKYQKRIKILTQLTAIAKNNITLDSDYDFILPLPGHPKNLKTRDYSPTYIIAKNLKLNSCINSNILNHSGIGEIQSLSDQKNRIDNACKNFSINFNKMILGSSLLLVDDVITTGASVEVISRLLLEAGANRIDVFCLAHSTKFITQTGETDDNRQNL